MVSTFELASEVRCFTPEYCAATLAPTQVREWTPIGYLVPGEDIDRDRIFSAAKYDCGSAAFVVGTRLVGSRVRGDRSDGRSG